MHTIVYISSDGRHQSSVTCRKMRRHSLWRALTRKQRNGREKRKNGKERERGDTVASIRSIIEMIDRVSAPLQNIRGNLSVTVSGFEDGQEMVTQFSRSFDDTQMTSGINNVNNAVGQLPGKFSQAASAAERMRNTGNNLFRTLMGFSAVRGAINMVKNQMNSAIQRMDTMTNFNRTMTAITGDSQAAKVALEELKSATKGTEYGLDTAAASVQNFTTRGMDIENATAEVKYWADAVAFYGNGTNEALSTVTDALGKMMTKGTVEMDQLNRLTDVGIPAVNMYAQATGRAAASVQEDLSAGEISAQKFITTVSRAFETGTNGVLNISGAAKKAGDTWATTISNMKAAVTRGLTSMVNKTNEQLEKAGFGTIQDGIKKIGVAAENALGKIGSVLGRGIAFFAEHREQILLTIQVLGSLAAGYMLVSGAIGTVTTVIGLCQTAMALFGTTAGIVFGITSIVAIAGVAFAIFELIEWIKDLNGKTGDTGKTMELVFKKAEVIIANVSAVWAGFIGGAKILWNDLCLGIEVAWRSVYGVILGIIYLIGDAIRSLVNGAIAMINGMIESLNTIPGVSIGVIKEVAWTGIDDIGKMAQDQFDAIYNATVETDKKNQEIADDIVNKQSAADQAQREYDELYKKYTSGNDGLAKSITDAANAGKEVGDRAKIVSGIGGIKDGTKKTAANTANMAKQLSITSEQLKYIKDYATAKAVNRYTSSTIKVTMNNNNNISNDMDIDGITDKLKTHLEEKLGATAEGVHA